MNCADRSTGNSLSYDFLGTPFIRTVAGDVFCLIKQEN